MIARNEMARYLTHHKPDLVSKGKDVGIAMPPPPTAVAAAMSSQASGKKTADGPDSTASSVAPVEVDDWNGELWAEAGVFGPSDFASQPGIPRAVLPPAIDDARACTKCYAAEGCMLYRRAVEKVVTLFDGTADGGDQALDEAYKDNTSHLTDAQCDFFEKWERLITLEERETIRLKKEIWTMNAHERERHGRCLADMIIDSGSAEVGLEPQPSKSGTHRFRYRMVRCSTTRVLQNTGQGSAALGPAPLATPSSSLQPLTAGQLSVGDPVVVSIEPNVLALARGFIIGLDADFLDIGLDHSITALPGDACDGFAPTSGQILDEVVYRIDKDELQAGMGKIRDNLAQLFYAKGDEKRRRLIVDLEKPKFRPLEAGDERATRDSTLDADQLEAVDKVLTARDYALILGMPGTGKTTTIAEVIKALVSQGKSILLTSYTHSAVDNILAKIQHLAVKMLRLGNVDKVGFKLHEA